MIEIISPSHNSTIGGRGLQANYSTRDFWHASYLRDFFRWLTGIDLDTDSWPDGQGGGTVYVYTAVIWGRTDSLRYSIDCENHNQEVFQFHPLDDYGVPMDDVLFTTEVGDTDLQNITYTFHISLPLAVSWIDPATEVRSFAQGNRCIIGRTEENINGDCEEHKRPFSIDVRPPSQPVLDQDNQVVSSRSFNITGSVANVSCGSYLIRIRS